MADRNFITRGIILKTNKFRETSIIFNIFSKDFGKISVIGKGLRNIKSKYIGLIDNLNEVELELYKNPESELYLFKSGKLLENFAYGNNYRTQILLSAAAELYNKIIFPIDEVEQVYNLLNRYLGFMQNTKKNNIAIFWRFLLRLFKILGIDLDPIHCIRCNSSQNKMAAFSVHSSGFICQKCYHHGQADFVVNISEETAEILTILPNIGNYLDEIAISNKTIQELNNIFILHLSEHFHQNFRLKSLETLR
ncbi:MAG: DNA repair protein RecO [Candidatus Cloacimonadota bacterium]|nr:DNA repair protein RecO [Candidatus Cloacimonadota bacterium]